MPQSTSTARGPDAEASPQNEKSPCRQAGALTQTQIARPANGITAAPALANLAKLLARAAARQALAQGGDV